MTHALARTSPKGEGEKFIGRCIKCGEENLGILDSLKPCSMDGKTNEEKILLALISGELDHE